MGKGSNSPPPSSSSSINSITTRMARSSTGASSSSRKKRDPLSTDLRLALGFSSPHHADFLRYKFVPPIEIWPPGTVYDTGHAVNCQSSLHVSGIAVFLLLQIFANLQAFSSVRQAGAIAAVWWRTEWVIRAVEQLLLVHDRSRWVR